MTSTAITTVAEGRTAIDDVDRQIVSFLTRRRELSRQVQDLRRHGGVPGIQPSRETEILRIYEDALGTPGAEIGAMVLRLCRGPAGPLSDD